MRSLAEDGTAIGPAGSEPDLAAAVSARGRDGDVRWVWQSAAALYPALLRAGVRVTRCHDIRLAEGLLAGRDGPARDGAADHGGVADGGADHGNARRDAEAMTRLVRPGQPASDRRGGQPGQLAFEDSAGARAERAPADVLADVIAAHASHAQDRGGIRWGPGSRCWRPWNAGSARRAELVAGLFLAPTSMTASPKLLGLAAGPGLPVRPARLAELIVQISAELGAVRPVNLDSPSQLLRALAAGGIRVPSTGPRSCGPPIIRRSRCY